MYKYFALYFDTDPAGWTYPTYYHVEPANLSNNKMIATIVLEADSVGTAIPEDDDDDPIGDPIGDHIEKINEYVLSTPWDVSTATLDYTDYIDPHEIPNSLGYSSDGLNHYYMQDTEVIHLVSDQPYSSTIISQSSFFATAQEPLATGVYIPDNGQYLYITGLGGVGVNQYILTTVWDITSATHQGFFSTGAHASTPSGITISPDGSRMYITDSANLSISQYALATPWDVTSAIHQHTQSLADGTLNPFAFYFTPDGNYLFLAGVEVSSEPSDDDPNSIVTQGYVRYNAIPEATLPSSIRAYIESNLAAAGTTPTYYDLNQ